LHNLVFVKFNAKIKSKTSSINRDPLAAIDDEERVTDWLVPPKTNGAPASESDDEVFPGEGLTWRQVGKSSGATIKKRKSSRTKLKTFKRKAKSGGPSNNEREEDMESSSSESSSEDESHEVELNLTRNDVIDSEDSEPEFSED